MIQVLTEAGIEFEMPKVSSFTEDFSALKDAYKSASTPLLVKRAEQARGLLRKKIKEDPEALVPFLKWERAVKKISVADEYLLNSLEKELYSDRCLCINQILASTPEQVGEEYPFYSYFDESRGTDMYVVFTNRVIPPESQIPPKLQWKIEKGFMPEESDYPPEKTVWHRQVFTQPNFDRYFRIDEY